MREPVRPVAGLVAPQARPQSRLAIPYPGPGWLILFAGLAILGTEFTWAKRALRWTRARYEAWTGWVRQQPAVVRIGVIALTGARRLGHSLVGERLRPGRRMGRSARGLGAVTADLILYGDAATAVSSGRLAQRESASFTPKRSLVRSQYRPPEQLPFIAQGPIGRCVSRPHRPGLRERSLLD